MAVYVFGHKNPDLDSVAAAIAFAGLNKARGKDYVAVMQGKANPETVMVLQRFGFAEPEIMTDATAKQVALVDHSDSAQAPDNLSAGEVTAIVDHHKVGDITTDQPIFFYCQPVGCTCTVLKEMYDQADIKIPPKIAGLMLGAILSDTVHFKSPTCTEADKKAVAALAAIAGVSDTSALFMDMLKAKSAVEGATPLELLHRDYKDFDMNGQKVGVGQLELASLDQVAHMRDTLYEAMKGEKSGGRHSVLLMLTDVVREGTELLVLSDDPALIEKAFGEKLSGHSMWIDGMMSRKKQVIPSLQKVFHG